LTRVMSQYRVNPSSQVPSRGRILADVPFLERMTTFVQVRGCSCADWRSSG
jgi:hypothetical protein